MRLMLALLMVGAFLTGVGEAGVNQEVKFPGANLDPD